MLTSKFNSPNIIILTFLGAASLSAQENNQPIVESLPTLTVLGQETANQRPVTTYETPISNLDFDPRIDMQSRNMAEAQGDLSIRGGTFEETGLLIGGSTVLDPQTGHYTAELPIAPEMLGEPKVLTGSDNALRGFNSNAGTISYSWKEITNGGSLTLGAGDHALNFQRLHHALTGQYANSEDWTWGAEIEGSRSESDGTIPFGDHSFKRTSGRVQLLGPDSQTDFFAGYQEKFFGLPGMYTGNSAFHETEDLLTKLFMFNNKHNYENESILEVSGYYRCHDDQFILKRNNPSAYLANHETSVRSLAISGTHAFDNLFSINYKSEFTKDEINSLNLGNGPFNSREYLKLSLLPQYDYELNNLNNMTFKLGATFDESNRDNSRISPISEISLLRKKKDILEKSYLSYSETTQVLGYTAIGGAKTSPFISDPNLMRGISKNLEFGYNLKTVKWKLNGAIFKRWNKDLVDWIYTSPNTRSAKHVDVDTFGFEVILSWQSKNFETITSYSYLKKDEDYGDASIKRSLYTLNYPEHRATFGFIWKPYDIIKIRMDNEWREQRENDGRSGPDETLNSYITTSYYPSQINDLEIFIAFDKPWDEDFQDIPGTPGRGDQFSLGATYRW